ncbi:MAG: BON domain-containing protein, partial [Erysipelotrichaceae bacterium]|nr:BON domain-containing protein [Erysipelotrichaceae bacterium]
MAELIAEGVEGVKEVDNRIEVGPQAQRDAQGGSFKRTVDDANITAKVKSKLLLNPHTRGLKITVTTKNAVVIFDGEVG